METYVIELWCYSPHDIQMHANSQAGVGWELVNVIPGAMPPLMPGESPRFVSGPYTFVFKRSRPDLKVTIV